VTAYSLYVPSRESEIDSLCSQLAKENKLSEFLVELIKRDVGVVMSANLKRAKDDVAFWEGMLENGRDIEGIGDRVKREKAVALDKLVYLWIRGNRGDYGIEDNGSWLNGHKDLVSIIFGGKPVGVDEVIKKIKEVNE